jgi:hypothetical protein
MGQGKRSLPAKSLAERRATAIDTPLMKSHGISIGFSVVDRRITRFRGPA